MDLNLEQIKTMVANQMKAEGVNDLLPENSIDSIAEKIKDKINLDNSKKSVPTVVSEDMGTEGNNMISEPIEQLPINNNLPIAAPSVIQNEPELPDFAKKTEPSQLFVFDMNDLSEGGENLANKPFRTIENPDDKKSMHDFWIKEGKVKADIYICKFEKIGQINYNYANNTAQYIDNKFSDIQDLGQSDIQYQTNPYGNGDKISLENKELENYVKTSVDLKQTITDIVMNIIKNSVLTNSERAVNDVSSVDNNVSIAPIAESFTLNIKDVIDNDDDYEKVDLPEELNESILKNDKKYLINENDFIQEWNYNNKKYYTPKERISKTKGYIKL